ncbi:hypothetical protein G6F64_005967 [Rhizopus arrhizus]|uniref:Uncharacterized protein n=1 Tax=Rhizopus oryzae TaxID=64495 RepID=A0A9P6X9M3_RHIOR|nr:hypothetical protein G6F64_005967 [Rhizopus arrhizus]
MRLTTTGLYTFTEIAHLQFADSVENLPSFCTLVNIKKLLAINNVFWRYCKKSSQPEKIEARYAKTLTTLNDLIDGKQDSSRSRVLRYEQGTRFYHFPLPIFLPS